MGDLIDDDLVIMPWTACLSLGRRILAPTVLGLKIDVYNPLHDCQK